MVRRISIFFLEREEVEKEGIDAKGAAK